MKTVFSGVENGLGLGIFWLMVF